MLQFSNRSILIIAPHPDDEVIGSGGFIIRAKAANARVHVLFLTVGTSQDYSSQGKSSEAERRQETSHVAQLLRLDSYAFAFPGDQYHLQLDQVPQRDLINTIENHPEVSLKTVQPDILIIPSITDYNQDHRAASQAAFTAARPCLRKHKHSPDLIMSYETPMDYWSQPPTPRQPNIYISLNQTDLEHKIAAMHGYQSQVREHGHPRNEVSMRALAALRGSAIGMPFAEAFYGHKFFIA
jgi:N-acetylglucosamine malate deacetylase 1